MGGRMQHPRARGRFVLALAVGAFGLANANCGKSSTEGAPSNLTYSVNSATYTLGTAIAANMPTSSGGPVTSYSVSPALPAGLGLDTASGVMSGTPTAVSASANYTVTATNSNGSTSASISITVNDVAPSDLTYSDENAVYTQGTPIIANAPSSAGGRVVAYSVSPALPAGLTLSTSTGVISGTPTAVAATANYTVTATNSGGKATTGLSITINDLPPATLSYSDNPAVYTRFTAITPNTPSNTGGAVGSYSVAPALPAGLSLSMTTGVISGTPTVAAAMANYTVTAVNSVGSTTASVSITVKEVPPINLTYSANPATYTLETPILPNTPTNGGGTVVSYSVAPALPAGLTLSPTTGVISGTPTTTAATANYTVTAMNAVGSTTASISITVNDLPPTALKYSTNPAVYPRFTAITPNTPSNTGGAVGSYSVSPPLPAGLSLSPTTGVISGTPTVVTAAANYTVTASNFVGSTTVGVSIAVTEAAPANLTYAVNPATYTKGTAITPNGPSSAGGPVVSYAVAPPLPASLNFSTTTGVISGTPTAITATAGYVVTATNSVGNATVSVAITINDIAPNNLAYSPSSVTYTKGTAITPLSPTSAGGPVVSYSSSPPLPGGLSLNTTTGVISGTPSAVAATANYTLTATNTGGSATAIISITVNDVAPSALAYSSPVTYTKGNAITPNTPTSAGGAVVSYTVLPALPAGLTLSPTTGIISGTPTVLSAMATYTVTAGNSGGSTTAGVTITVVDSKPTNLVYSSPTAVYTVGTPITQNTPSNSGGTIVTYTVAPTLPAGLVLNPSTGVISGTPTAIAPTASYVVTGTNAIGSTTASISITVNDVPPSALVYTPNPATYVKGVAITTNTPTHSGGAAVSYALAPAEPLPPGLVFSTTTGAISGTPTAITASGPHTVTATNSGGSTSVVLTITVTDAPPTGLTYLVNPAKYTKGTPIAPNTATNGGGTVISYGVLPALPTGLSLSTTTGTISGTPSVLAVAATYTVTATNSGGFTTAGVSITVVDVPPANLSYSAPTAVYTLGSAIPVNVPSSTGGAVVSYSALPALPAGLSLNAATGIISGIPTQVTAAGSHTITATNTGGSATAMVSITVNPLEPSRFAYATNSGENTVSMYTVDATTGALRANGYVAAGTGPRSITVDPSGKFAYVANITSGNISTYTINLTTGVLNPSGLVTAGSRPFSITVDPTGRFAYVPNFDSNDVSAFSINQTTGALTSIGPTVPAGTGPTGARALTVDPTGRFAYAVNETENDIWSYAINGSTGALTSLGPPVASGMAPISVTVDPTGSFVYVANQNSNDVSAYAINPNTGALTSAGPTVAAGTEPSSVTVDPSGKFVYVANTTSNGISAYSITAGTGVLKSLGMPVAAAGPIWVAIDPSGEIAYVADFFTNQISSFLLNTSTGALTPFQTLAARSMPSSVALAQGASAVHIVPKFAYVANKGSADVSAFTISGSGALGSVSGSPFAAGTNPASVAVDPSGSFAYVANSGSGTVSAYTINSSSGALASVSGSPFAAGTTPSSVAVDPSGRFVYVANAGSNNVQAYSITAGTGALTNVGVTAAGTTPISIAVEPSGRFLYAANSGSNDVSGYSIGAAGALTSLGATVPAGTGPSSIAVDPTGTFAFVSNSAAGTVSAFVITSTTGILVVNPAVPFTAAGTTPSSVTVDPSGGFVYATNSGSDNVSIYSISTTSGALIANGSPVGAGTAPSSIGADPSGAFAYVANSTGGTVSAYTINTSGVLVGNGSATAGSNPQSVTTSASIQ
jgi:6-phosphogluconolactonase (cycloisomerase 2 family)